MNGRTVKQLAGIGILAIALGVSPAVAQKKTPESPQVQQFAGIEDQPDAQRTHTEFDRLLNHYPPTVRGVFKQDPTLMNQAEYLKPYPALANFLSAHPEIA